MRERVYYLTAMLYITKPKIIKKKHLRYILFFVVEQ